MQRQSMLLSERRMGSKMENAKKQKLTLDQSAVYQIQVPGNMDEAWLDWYGEIAIDIGSSNIILTAFFFLFNLIGLPTYTGWYDQFLIVVGLGFNLLTVWYAWHWLRR